MYEELIKKLRNRRVCIQSGGDLDKDFPLMEEAAQTILDLEKNLKDCRNALCLYCGQYKTAYLGSCDGCGWEDVRRTDK